MNSSPLGATIGFPKLELAFLRRTDDSTDRGVLIRMESPAPIMYERKIRVTLPLISIDSISCKT